MTQIAEIKFDKFASRIFQREVIVLAIKEHGDALARELPAILAEYRKRTPVLICAKVPTEKINTVTLLEAAGFRVIDTNIVLKKPVEKGKALNGNCEIRFATEHDAGGVRAIAGSEFQYSRFHLDPGVSDKLADQFKEEWAGNFFSGQRGDRMVVAEINDQLAGFLQLLHDGNKLIIDLMAVASAFRRQSVGADMIIYAEDQAKQFDSVQVGTQVGNVPALRFYEKLGFRTVGSSYVLHYHNG